MKSYVGVNGVARSVYIGGQSGGAASIGVGTRLNIPLNGLATEFIVVQRGLSKGYGGGTDDDIVCMTARLSAITSMFNNSINDNEDYSLSFVHAVSQNEVYHRLSADIQAQVLTRKIPYRPGNTAGSTTIASGSIGFAAAAWVPSPTELGMPTDSPNITMGTIFEYFALFNDTKKRMAGNSDTAATSQYWTRAPALSSTSTARRAVAMGATGAISAQSLQNSYPVRTCIVLPSSVVKALAI